MMSHDEYVWYMCVWKESFSLAFAVTRNSHATLYGNHITSTNCFFRFFTFNSILIMAKQGYNSAQQRINKSLLAPLENLDLPVTQFRLRQKVNISSNLKAYLIHLLQASSRCIEMILKPNSFAIKYSPVFRFISI